VTQQPLPSFRIERLRSDDGSAFSVAGTLDSSAARKLERMLAGPASDGNVVTLDLADLQSCDAAGVEALVGLTRRAHLASGDLLLLSVPTAVRHTFITADVLQKLHVAPDGHAGPSAQPRYLYRKGESVPYAYASSRHDYSLVRDGSLWAHQSHGWLLEAGSGSVIAHRTHGSYFSPETGDCLFTHEPSDAPATTVRPL
jgi:anti-anti-sigma factor